MAEPLSLGKERAGGCAPAESHNQIIALDSSFVYQAVTKGQLLSKNSHKAESSDNLRCLITVHPKPLAPSLNRGLLIVVRTSVHYFNTVFKQILLLPGHSAENKT